MENKFNLKIIGIIFIVTLLLIGIFFIFYTINYYRDYPCLERSTRCYNQITILMYNAALKTSMPSVYPDYVPCSGEHEYEEEYCSRR